MFGKIEISGKLEVLTGMHIGGSDAFAAIGAVDAPVMKDSLSNLPMIPGSSLKGKMRTLLAKQYNSDVTPKPDDDCERLTRLFGSAKKGNIKRSRIQFGDMVVENDSQLRSQGIQSMTEIKFENSINRATAVANPRQIERVIRGAEFSLKLLYEVEKQEELLEDFETLAEGFKLLQYDYLGGHGSRGYGRIAFHDLTADLVVGQMDEGLIEQCNQMLKKAVEG